MFRFWSQLTGESASICAISSAPTQVLNNLDDSWQDTFATAMSEWDNGTPDAVTFLIQRTSDPACRMVRGVMVVCNGDYGRTSWRGINELVTENGWLVASVAKLNDHFLGGADADLRQYVCCHEVGHGLGLGHTDENAYNPDLFECMDYTARPANNMHPGPANFELLERMYGNVDGSSVRDDFRELGEERRLSSGDDSDEGRGWRLLRRSAHAEHYEISLGDGVKIRRVLLLA